MDLHVGALAGDASIETLSEDKSVHSMYAFITTQCYAIASES